MVPDFSNFHSDEASKGLFNDAYETACDELIVNYYVSVVVLQRMAPAMKQAIIDFYRAGQRDERKLAKYAVARALESVRIKRHY